MSTLTPLRQRLLSPSLRLEGDATRLSVYARSDDRELGTLYCEAKGVWHLTDQQDPDEEIRALLTCGALCADHDALAAAQRRWQREDYDRLRGIWAELGITETALPIFGEARALVYLGQDRFERELWLTPDAQAAAQALLRAARADGVTLDVLSTFRSWDYQRGIFARKLTAGQRLDQILRANAPPGCSEHHTGRAIDFATTDQPPLERVFEKSAAFEWLSTNATRFGFLLSYPEDNAYGIDYEPWHWCYAARSEEAITS